MSKSAPTAVNITCFGRTVFGCNKKATVEVNDGNKLSFFCNSCCPEIKFTTVVQNGMDMSGSLRFGSSVPYPLLPRPNQVKYKCINPENPYPIRIDSKLNEHRSMVHIGTSSVSIEQIHYLNMQTCAFYCVFNVFDYCNPNRRCTEDSGGRVNDKPLQSFDEAYRLLCDGILMGIDRGLLVSAMNKWSRLEIREHCRDVIYKRG